MIWSLKDQDLLMVIKKMIKIYLILIIKLLDFIDVTSHRLEIYTIIIRTGDL